LTRRTVLPYIDIADAVALARRGAGSLAARFSRRMTR
jgi:hypothetical protein